MSFKTSKKSDKILIIGLAESGKTTIIKVVTEGFKPNKKAGYTATLNYERKETTLMGKQLTLFDLGGQVAFLDRFTGDLAEFIFSDVAALIFVVDVINVAELSRAKYYFDLAIKRITSFSPSAKLYCFLHKIDLINQAKIADISDNMKKYLMASVKNPIVFFETTVFTDSIFSSVGKIFGEASGATDITKELEKFVKENNDVIVSAQLFSENNVPLFGSESFSHIKPHQTRKGLHIIAKQLSSRDQNVNSMILETELNIFLMYLLRNGTTLILALNKQGLLNRPESVGSFYDKATKLAHKLYI